MPRKLRRSDPDKNPSVPLGLRAVFSAMQSDEYRRIYGSTDPDVYLDVVAALQSTERDGLTGAIAAATEREFGKDPDDLASHNVVLVSITAFWAGVAACWHYMSPMNGGAK